MNNTIKLTSLLSSDNRPINYIHKLDHTGRYTLFEGITVVMPLLTDLSAMYNELEQVVPKDVQALLPLSSYHITLTGVRCRNHFRTCEKYNEFL